MLKALSVLLRLLKTRLESYEDPIYFNLQADIFQLNLIKVICVRNMLSTLFLVAETVWVTGDIKSAAKTD